MDLAESYGKPESMHRGLLAVIFSLMPIMAAAQDSYLPDVARDQPMTESEVHDTFSGKTHRGSYNFKIKDFEGFHFEEWTSESGQVLHRMGDRVDKGLWTQKGDQICYNYDSDDLLPACFSFYRRGNCIYHQQETVGGKSSPGFTAVTVIKGEVPSCEPPLS